MGRLFSEFVEEQYKLDPGLRWRVRFAGVVMWLEGFLWRVRCWFVEDVIEDGFGNVWSARCSKCGRYSMQVVRPGEARCAECDDGAIGAGG